MGATTTRLFFNNYIGLNMFYIYNSKDSREDNAQWEFLFCEMKPNS